MVRPDLAPVGFCSQLTRPYKAARFSKTNTVPIQMELLGFERDAPRAHATREVTGQSVMTHDRPSDMRLRSHSRQGSRHLASATNCLASQHQLPTDTVSRRSTCASSGHSERQRAVLQAPQRHEHLRPVPGYAVRLASRSSHCRAPSRPPDTPSAMDPHSRSSLNLD